MANLPVNFEEKARQAKQASGGGYPVQISAGDLMRNFVHAALDADESLIEPTTGQGGHPARKLKIPAVPSGGTHVLGAVDGALAWQDGVEGNREFYVVINGALRLVKFAASEPYAPPV